MPNDINAKLAACEASLKRWHTRLIMVTNKIGKLEKQRRRLLAASHWEAQAKPKAKTTDAVIEAKAQLVQSVMDRLDEIASPPAPTDDLKIPAIFDRSNPAVAEEMTKARKKAEADARKAMPLSGKAALEAVRPKRKAKTATV